MKFATVEYTTKTRKIWVPSTEHPNFLADPLTEIDPTSFGSYTTALHGEHIPLTGAILGELDGRLFSPFLQRLRWKLTGQWGKYSLQYFQRFDTLLVVYDWRRGRELADFVEQIRTAQPHTVVIGVPTHPFGMIRDAWRDERVLTPLIRFYNNCHAVLSLARHTAAYQQALTTTRVIYMPQPYPIEFAEDFYHKPTQKNHSLLVAGETSRIDILAGQLAARTIQRKHPDLTIHVTATPDSPLNTIFLHDTRHEVMPFKKWREYLPYLADVCLVINTDMSWTRGRVQVDCAAVGTPSIGGPTDGQIELFPDLVVRDIEDFGRMEELGLQLLNDMRFYENVTQKARRRAQEYSFEKTVQRFTKLVQSIRDNRLDEFPDFVWENDILVEKPHAPRER